MKLILASASPRRRELLAQAGLEFEVCPSTIEEKMIGDTPGEIVVSLARQKAGDVFSQLCADKTCTQIFAAENSDGGIADNRFTVLGADTIVVCDGRRLGKPADAGEAFRMLKLLQNRTHEVYTGVCMITGRLDSAGKVMAGVSELSGNIMTGSGSDPTESIMAGSGFDPVETAFFECTRVSMYPISDELARWYISTGEPMDKAGAYGIQGKGAVLIRGIEGDYNNVVGLPLARVWNYLYKPDINYTRYT